MTIVSIFVQSETDIYNCLFLLTIFKVQVKIALLLIIVLPTLEYNL